ncbi:Fpg/Nei family DNA glycosylase, partial [Candidatus Gracilibacteria bacterium]|nr:Fpg/Nei family DNA glycosylase [Candidatus Gracilibacteria bacterium]
MAEVPEVEILVRDMNEQLPGRAIKEVRVTLPEVVRFPEPAQFTTLLAGQRFTHIVRRAKHMLCTLENNLLLEMHCMLHGTLRLYPTHVAPTVETLISYQLEDGAELHFLDRLGYARASAGPMLEVQQKLRLNDLGPEALDPHFSPELLLKVLHGRRGKLKSTLLNQRILAGLGNRDADESFWHARINPLRIAGSLSSYEGEQLCAAILYVLREGINLRGTMTDLSGKRGAARQRRCVYGQGGQPCPRCKTPIIRTMLGQQITFFCPSCQPETINKNAAHEMSGAARCGGQVRGPTLPAGNPPVLSALRCFTLRFGSGAGWGHRAQRTPVVAEA